MSFGIFSFYLFSAWVFFPFVVFAAAAGDDDDDDDLCPFLHFPIVFPFLLYFGEIYFFGGIDFTFMCFQIFFYGLFDLFCLLCCFMRFFSGLLVSFLFGVLTLFPGLSLLFFYSSLFVFLFSMLSPLSLDLWFCYVFIFIWEF